MITKVAIFGAGTMGGGIAITCLKAGLDVTVIDTGDAALDRLQQRVTQHLQREIDKGRMDKGAAATAQSHLRLSAQVEDAAGADLVIEAVFEDLGIKQDLLRRIEPFLAQSTVIATNTSCLLVGDIAKALRHPDRLLGLHYFSPAEIAPTVEVVASDATRSDVIAAAMAFLQRTKKSPLPCKDSPGFALNRFFCPYCNEAARLLDEGVATTGQIDAVACASLDVAAGPFRVMNLTKPVIMMKAVESLAALGPSYRLAAGLAAVGAAGQDWSIEPDPAPLCPQTSAHIADRLTAAVLRPALDALAEGVVRPEDLDRGAKEALKFGKTPVALRDSLPASELDRLLALLAA